MLRCKTLAFWQDSECRFFIGAVLLTSLVESLNVFGSVYETIGQALRCGVFQVVAIIGNIGPGFGMVGPVENYAQIPFLGKWLLIWCMLLGRLEIFTVIILVVPEFWRK